MYSRTISTFELRLSHVLCQHAMQNKFPVKQPYRKITATCRFKVAPMNLELNHKLSRIKIAHSSRAAWLRPSGVNLYLREHLSGVRVAVSIPWFGFNHHPQLLIKHKKGTLSSKLKNEVNGNICFARKKSISARKTKLNCTYQIVIYLHYFNSITLLQLDILVIFSKIVLL